MIIDPLIVGTHEKKTVDGVTILPGHTGSVTLLRASGENILIDTGARGKMDQITEELQKRSLSAEDISAVILTHLHLDHAYNVAYFTQARVFAWSHEWCDGQTVRIDDLEQWNEFPGIRLLKTPGHAEEHFSVVVEDDDGKTVVIAGDAINEGFARTGEVSVMTYDEELYRRSAEKILSIADRIIPGHGQPFAPDQ